MPVWFGSLQSLVSAKADDIHSVKLCIIHLSKASPSTILSPGLHGIQRQTLKVKTIQGDMAKASAMASSANAKRDNSECISLYFKVYTESNFWSTYQNVLCREMMKTCVYSKRVQLERKIIQVVRHFVLFWSNASLNKNTRFWWKISEIKMGLLVVLWFSRHWWTADFIRLRCKNSTNNHDLAKL